MDPNARFQAMEDAMTRLMQMVENLQVNNNSNNNNNYYMRDPRELEDKTLKVEIPELDGSLDPEVFLEWERSLERNFEFKDTPEEKKCKVARLKTVKHASLWFDGVQNQRVREGKAKINTWPKLLKQLRRKFVPTTYLNQMYSKWSSLEQGAKSVGEYLKEFGRLSIVCDINEKVELKLSRFINGLNMDLKEKIEAQPYVSFEEACKLAITFESQRKRRTSSVPNPFRTPTPTSRPVRNIPNPNPSSTSSRPIASTIPIVGKETPRRDCAKPIEIVCFKCHGVGHRQSQWPNARAFTNMEWNLINSRREVKRAMLIQGKDGREELYIPATSEHQGDGVYEVNDGGTLRPFEEGESSHSSSKVLTSRLELQYTPIDSCYPEDGEDDEGDEDHGYGRTLVIRRNFHATPLREDHPQRENIFQTKGKILGKICDIVGVSLNKIRGRIFPKKGRMNHGAWVQGLKPRLLAFDKLIQYMGVAYLTS